jgi:hypothetical protein
MHSRPCLGPPDPWFGVRARSRRSRPEKVYYWEGALKFWFNKLCQKMIDHASRSTRGPGASKNMICPTKTGLLSRRSRRSTPNQVDYWEGTLQLLFYKLCMKMIDHGSRSTWGTGPSRSGLASQKYDLPPPPLKRSFPTTFV